ncbi:MAG: DUF72 domain-containing protein [Thermoplasmatota archaeon]
MKLQFGLGAWSNKHFEHTLYPLRTKHAEYLGRYGAVFPTVEVDKLYHFAADAQELYAWAEQAPDHLTFLPKMHKTVCAEDKDDAALQRAKEHIKSYEPLGSHLGPILSQFPPSWGYTEDDLDWLASLLKLAPGRMSVELRNDSWWRDETKEVLEANQAPLVWSTHHKAPAPAWTTGAFGHVRFVGPHFKDKRGRHTTQEDRLMDILAMRERIQVAPWDECHVIITNTFEGNAIDSLPRICAALGEPELAKRVTRAPGSVLFPDAVGRGQGTLF